MPSKTSSKTLTLWEITNLNCLIKLASEGDGKALDLMAQRLHNLDNKGRRLNSALRREYRAALKEFIEVYDELRRERRKITHLGYEDAAISLNQSEPREYLA